MKERTVIRLRRDAPKGARLRLVVTTAMATASVGIAGICTPPAAAWVGGTPLNGRFLATSNGDWAKTNEVFRDEKTVRQVWTVSSTCVDSTDCSGQINSSEGWEAELRYDGAWWFVDRTIPNWQPCQDGTFGSGTQRFRFWGVDDNGQTEEANTSLLAGNDTTFGESGACGINKVLVIALPLRLQRIDP
jgi:hypothetical protein